MIVVWERRVRAALLQQRAVPLAMRLEGARLVATGIWMRWRRSWWRLAVTTFVVLVLVPAALVLDLLVKAL